MVRAEVEWDRQHVLARVPQSFMEWSVSRSIDLQRRKAIDLVIIIQMGMDIMDATNSMSEVGNIVNKECQLVVYKYVIND